MRRALLLSIGVLLITSGQFFIEPIQSYAKSVTWSQNFTGKWYGVPSWDIALPVSSQKNTGDEFRDPHIEVTYKATVSNVATGEVIPPNGCVPQGTDLKFTFEPHTSTDVYWFATGYSYSSPYGDWKNNAGSGPISCEIKDAVFDSPHNETFYVPLVVNPPSGKVLTNTTGLSCTTPATNGSVECAASGSGVVNPSFDIPSTYGYFYYRFDSPHDSLGCQGFNTPLSTTYNSPAQTGGTQIPVSAVSIPYPLCIQPVTTPPNPPTITATIQQCPEYSITLQATDPDGDQVRYGIDWDNNGTINEWVPATGYVASGQSHTVSHTFTDGTTQNFKVYTQDAGGMLSTPTQQSLTVPTCPRPPTVVLAADKTTLTYGESTTLRWEASANADSCTGIGFTTGGAIKGAIPITPTQTTTYTVQCTNTAGSGSDTETVAVRPVITKCDAFARDVGDQSAFSATAFGGKPPYILWEWSGTDGLNGTSVTSSRGGGNRSEDFNWVFQTRGPKTVQVRVKDSSNVWSDWYQCPTITVNSPPPPDIMSYRPSIMGNPTSVTAGTPLTLRGNAHSNVWYVIAGPFSDIFEYSKNNGATWTTVFIPPPVTDLAGHSDRPETAPFTPLTSGTYLFRHCVDLPANVLAESDENNNCALMPSLTVTGTYTPQCSDGIDNIDPEDTLIDFGSDPGCTSTTDDDETDTPTTTQCSDGVDNTDPEDSLVDFGQDPGCTSTTDDDETDLPDLISENLTKGGGAGSVTVGTQVSFTATVKNNSATAITNSFSDVFQYSFNSGAWVPLSVPPSTANLAAGGTVPETGAFTPLTAGTYSVRHCADTPGNTVPESDELNNCGTAVTFAVTPGAVNPTVASCSVNPNPADIGETVTWSATATGGLGGAPYDYQWTLEGVVSARITNGNTKTTSYTSPGQKSASIQVWDSLGLSSTVTTCDTWATATVKPPVTPTATLQGKKTTEPASSWRSSTITISQGDEVLVRWSSSNATACTKNFVPGTDINNTTGVDVTEPSASNPSVDFTLTCTSANGATDSDILTVIYDDPTTPTITVDPTRVQSGDSVQLRANPKTHSNCVLSGPGIGSITISSPYNNPNVGPIVGQTDYTLSCPTYNSGAPLKATVRIVPRKWEE